MISFHNIRVKSAEQETLTLESSRGWFPAGRSRDRPMTESAALKVSAFYRAVDLRSDSIGRLPVTVKDLNTRLEVEDHYLGPILWERPNEAMTPFVYKKLVEYQRLVLGNAYVWIYRDRNGHPVELLPMPPGTCRPYIEPGTGVLWYQARDPKTGQQYWLHPEDILHYKGFSTNGIEGMSLLANASRTMGVAQSRDQYEEDIYRNGGRPSGVLSTDTDLSGKATQRDADGNAVSYRDVIRNEWERVHSGPGNAMRVAILDNSLKYTPISMSNADAQFVESKGISLADIARFTGVPQYLLYAGKESYQSNQANGVEYVKYTLQPAVTQYEEQDSLKLLLPSDRKKGLWIQRNMMAELRGDSATRRDWYKAMREIGVFSVNDICALEDIPAVPGGDTRNASLNYIPLEDFRELSRRRNGGGSEE